MCFGYEKMISEIACYIFFYYSAYFVSTYSLIIKYHIRYSFSYNDVKFKYF